MIAFCLSDTVCCLNAMQKERQQLMELLPECDKEALQQKRNPFSKDVFKAKVLHYHTLLGKGLLEREATTL